ncbi:hypothetical protein [Bradyrhizobium barranii]|uniref:Uncharacterized protein n=1 Tax=Bradyrhizobium barranii subsp. barranii TaxID=2823807 RepID=A0A939M9F8_9BRAD|nr:hypothetical protein [Bradyrhizobium barranii]UEM14929.1 hypothetical protein J4G43_012220 [Bradyrhizobium barranii subsp. barranii]
MLALIVETIKLYSSALSETASAEQKVAQLKRARALGEIPLSKKGSGVPVESYVQKQNIAYYETLLKFMSLGEDQRCTVEKLLSQEKEKLGSVNTGIAG